MEMGTQRYPEQPFVLRLQDPTVILPHSVIDEVKSLPSSIVSLEANNYRRFFGRYTLMGLPSHEFVTSIKHDLTRHVGNLLPEMVEETGYATNIVMGSSSGPDKIVLPVYQTMLQYIALLSGRAFIGLPLSRDEQWIHSSIQYAVESVAASHQLRSYPASLRRLVAPFLPRIWRVREHQKKVRMLLRDIIVNEQQTAHSNAHEPPQKGPLAFWLRGHYQQSGSPPTETALTKDHLLASFAAIHIATNAVTQVLLDLAARPEYQEALRQEITAILGTTSWARSITIANLNRMVKLDSFIKESLRISPPGGVVTMMRQTMVPFTPSCGPTLPPGTLIAFANNRFDLSTKPRYDPNEFDGFRFAEERQRDDGETKVQLITPNADSLTWGYGSHACPGRLFAACEIKVIAIYFLIHFDMQIKDGAARPPSTSHDFQIMPDMDAQISFRRRQRYT
ncbi:cytochrome P450 [Aspergillus floccosus]